MRLDAGKSELEIVLILIFLPLHLWFAARMLKKGIVDGLQKRRIVLGSKQTSAGPVEGREAFMLGVMFTVAGIIASGVALLMLISLASWLTGVLSGEV